MATVIAITSGKGGVGKTNVATNLGLALTARNAKVCVFDADTGLANINILLGIHPQYTIEQVLSGEMSVTDIIIETQNGLFVVPAASGVQRCADLPAEKRQLLIAALVELEKSFDYILIDTAAGIDSSVLDFVASAQYRIVVITPEPTSLTDSFALLKMLSIRGGKRNLFILINRVDDYKSSQKVFRRFQMAVNKYLKVRINYLGYLANDQSLVNAVSCQVPVVVGAPESSVSCCFYALADIVKRQFLNAKALPYFSHYWQKISAVGSDKKTLEKTVANRLQSRLKPESKPRLKCSEVIALLERQGYPEAQMRDLIVNMETVFEKTYGKPLKSTESVMADLLADVSGNEQKARLLHEALAHSFERQFHKKIDDPVAGLTQQMMDENYSRQEFSSLMRQFGQIYQQRFGVRYFGDSEQLLEQIFQLLQPK